MLRVLISSLLVISLSACVSQPRDPSFKGAGAFDRVEAAKTRVSLGLTYLQNGNFAQAKFNLDKALEFAPRDGQAHFAMAFYYQQVEEFERAEDSYEEALTFSKNDPDVLNSYGAFLCQRGNYDKAKGYFLQAVDDRNYVSSAETYENLALCSQSQGNKQEAIQYFNSALNHQPTRSGSLFLLTKLYVEEEQWDDAKKTLFKYERNSPISAESLYLQFQIAQGMNDTKTAMGYGEILKSMYPEHQHTKDYLASMGKFKPAASITRKLREPLPSAITEPDSASTSTNLIKIIDTTKDAADEIIQAASTQSTAATASATTAIAATLPAATATATIPTATITTDPVIEDATSTETVPTETEIVETVPTETASTETEIVETVPSEATPTEIEIVETVTTETPALESTSTAAAAPKAVNAPTTVVEIASAADDPLVAQSNPVVSSPIEEETNPTLIEAAEATAELIKRVTQQQSPAAPASVEDTLVMASEAEIPIDELIVNESSPEKPEQALTEGTEELAGVADETLTALEQDTDEALANVFEGPSAEEQNLTSSAQEEQEESVQLVDELDVSVADAETILESELVDEAQSKIEDTDAKFQDLTAEQGALIENEDFHIVLPKENLYRISLRYNVKMSRLLQWNNLNDASDIRIGSRLRVKAPDNNE